MSRPRIVVLVSGSGSNLQALLDASTGRHPEIELAADIAAVVSNVAGAYGLERAQRAGVATAVLEHGTFSSRESFDTALLSTVSSYSADLVILAGFMRILSPVFVQAFYGKLMNIHPSLLPKYPGLHTHERALQAGDKMHGASVHFVTEELDGGPVIVQASIPIVTNDTADRLAQRVLKLEHQIYPLAAHWFATGRLELAAEGALLDGKALPAGGVNYNEWQVAAGGRR